MLIYNLFPLLAGKFNEWDAHLKRAREMGFDWVYINPIQRLGRSGSLYSIANYFDVNPALADATTMLHPVQQARDAIARARQMGFSVMVDLVINHCAEDSDLVRRQPAWFCREPDGAVTHPGCDDNGQRVVWSDLAQFDHLHTSDPEGLARFFQEIVNFLLSLGIQGFRCDAAYQVPRDIWRRLIVQTKTKDPDARFFAETLGCTADQTKETALAGFDQVFNSSKWWDFQQPWLMAQYNLIREVAPSISFPESHDTERLCAEVNGHLPALKQRYAFAAFFAAGVMIPIGFEYGFRKRLHVVQARPTDWERTDIDLTEFIRRVNRVKLAYRIFQEECPTTVLGNHNPNVLLLWKASSHTKEEALLILNKDVWNQQQLRVDNLQQYVQAGAPLADVSPEDPQSYLPQPYEYNLRPGECRVLLTRRD